MSAEESTLRSKPIFTYIIPEIAGQSASLIRGVMITAEGVISFFARETVVCKNPGGGGPYPKQAFTDEGIQITNDALETVLSASMRDAWLNCFSSLRGYLVIEQESLLHSELHPAKLRLGDSKVFNANNDHMHMASPVLLQPEVLKCVLDALALGQVDFEKRQIALNSFFVVARRQRLEAAQCENKPKPIVDINRPAIPESEMLKLIKAYSEFFEQNKQVIVTTHNTTCTDGYLKHFPRNPVQANKQMLAQVSYFFSHIGNATYNAFFNAAIFSFIENVLKEYSTLEPSQISYLKNSVLLPAFLSGDMGVLLFAVTQIAQGAVGLSENDSALLTLGLNASIELLQAESANDITATTQVFSVIVGSAVASVAAGCADAVVSYGVKATHSLYSYFFPPSTAVAPVQPPQPNQPAINTPGFTPA